MASEHSIASSSRSDAWLEETKCISPTHSSVESIASDTQTLDEYTPEILFSPDRLRKWYVFSDVICARYKPISKGDWKWSGFSLLHKPRNSNQWYSVNVWGKSCDESSKLNLTPLQISMCPYISVAYDPMLRDMLLESIRNWIAPCQWFAFYLDWEKKTAHIKWTG